MAKIIDINKHGIRREIDHQYKPKKRIRPNKPKNKNNDIDISIVRSTDAPVMGANNVKRGN